MNAGRPARCSSGAQVRDFIHVDDVGEAFAALLASGLTGALNIGSGRGAMMIGERLRRPDLVALGALPDRKDDPPSLVADIHRLRGGLGVTPRPIEEGLADTIAWWRG